MLMQKFGRPFALSVINNDPPCVPTRVSSKLAIYVPPADLVDMYLQEIARGYGINWTSDRIKLDVEADKEEGSTGVEDETERQDDDKVRVSVL
jgi:vacuolar protein sorting-associated protein IST1